MNHFKPVNYLLIFLLSSLVVSCYDRCTCNKSLGCRIMTSNTYTDNTLVERKKYCSENNFYTDQTITDSSTAFQHRHRNDNTRVQLRDSIYYAQTTEKVKSKETGYYTKLGYYCECYK